MGDCLITMWSCTPCAIAIFPFSAKRDNSQDDGLPADDCHDARVNRRSVHNIPISFEGVLHSLRSKSLSKYPTLQHSDSGDQRR